MTLKIMTWLLTSNSHSYCLSRVTWLATSDQSALFHIGVAKTCFYASGSWLVLFNKTTTCFRQPFHRRRRASNPRPLVQPAACQLQGHVPLHPTVAHLEAFRRRSRRSSDVSASATRQSRRQRQSAIRHSANVRRRNAKVETSQFVAEQVSTSSRFVFSTSCHFIPIFFLYLILLVAANLPLLSSFQALALFNPPYLSLGFKPGVATM